MVTTRRATIANAHRRRVAPDDLKQALAEWRQLLGAEFVLSADAVRDHYARSTLPQGTRPLAVVLPASTDQVQDVVRVARRYRVPIYPISRGKNWGLGDACAVSDDQVIVDLGRMNRILEVNVPLSYAVIEPGVTQRQLFDYLQSRDLPLWLDATGAGPDASIVGNVMERGYGHTPFGDRFHNSCGFEVVLPDGRLLNTGFGHFPTSQVTNVFKTGIGPSLDGLFTQSNLGIVTRLCVWLMPKPPCLRGFAFSVPENEQIGAVVDALRPLRMLGVVSSTIHIANDLRVISAHHRYPWESTGGITPLPPHVRHQMRRDEKLGAWNVLGGLYGTRSTVRAAQRDVRRALMSVATPRFFGDGHVAAADFGAAVCKQIGIGGGFQRLVASVKSAYALLKGEPVADHLLGAAWRTRSNPSCDASDPLDRNDGLMWLTPVVPLLGNKAIELVELVQPIFQAYKFDPLLTFVIVGPRAMCCPMTICYDKQDGEDVARARQCYTALFDAVIERGFIPYRTGIQSMEKLTGEPSVHWKVLAELKRQLDPDNILAPGRYSRDGADNCRAERNVPD